MKRQALYGIVAAVGLWTGAASAQPLDGQYDYHVLERANEEGSQTNAWYGDNNWYNTYNYLGYRYSQSNPYTYSSIYSYPGVASPYGGYYYGGYGTDMFGNWDDEGWGDEDRDSGFFGGGGLGL